MSVTISGTTIRMTRGDTLVAKVGIMHGDEPYTPGDGDVVRFALKSSALNATRTDYADAEPLFVKTIPNDTLTLQLDPMDTKRLGFGDYVYDIQITFSDGRIDTFITEAKLILLPEVD